ncbi:MAG: VWA domain-containing protein [Clostridia bacterium]|nr:VWA domain-containing protein [Clostridia bacterium]
MKKAISILLAVVIAISVIVPGLTGLDFANFATKAEATTSRASDAYATVFTTSDFQDGKSGNLVESNFTKMINNALVDGCEEPDGFILGGDYESSYNYQHSTPDAYHRVENIITDAFPYYDKRNIIAVQGNHDLNDTSVLDDTGLYEFEHYLVYVIANEDYPAGTGGANALAKTQATAEKLTAVFDRLLAEGETRPIFIATHIPLHHNSRNPKANNTDAGGNVVSTGYNETLYSRVLFETINAYATVFDIIFFYGHNHSGDYDDYLGGAVNYLAKGEKIRIPDSSVTPSATSYTEESLNFTYMNYGYVGYTNNTNDKTLTMGVFEICPDRIEVTRYSTEGVYREHTINRKLKTNEASVSIASYGSGTVGSATGALATATGFTDPVYTWTTTDNQITTITANGRTAQISYNKVGTATLTVTVTERNDASKTATDSTSITVTDEEKGKVATIRVATQVVAQSAVGTDAEKIGVLEYYNATFGKEVSLVGSYEGFTANATTLWSSSDANVATVDNGVVKLVGSGTAFISYTATDANGDSFTAKVKFVVSNAPKVQYIYEEVPNTSISAGKEYAIATTRDGNTYLYNNTLGDNGQGATLVGTSCTFAGTSPNRTVEVSDDSFVWSTSSTGTDGVYYLQNLSSGEYLSSSQVTSTPIRGNFVLTSSVPSVSDGGWRIAANNNLSNGTYNWYVRGGGITNLLTDTKTDYVVLFEKKALNPTASIDFRGDVVDNTTQVLYSVTDVLKVPAYGIYTNIEQLGEETWTSSNQSVVTVDSDGMLSFKGVAGTSDITYTVTDAKSGQTYSATFTLEAKLGAEPTRTFKYTKTIQPGKTYMVISQKAIGDALALSGYKVTYEKLLAEDITVQVNSNNEFFVNVPADFTHTVWIPENAGDGTYYLKNEADGTYFYACSDGTVDDYGGLNGEVLTSESYETNTERYKWTYNGTNLYNQSSYTNQTTSVLSDVTYVRLRSANFAGIATMSQSEMYFYEEVMAEPNGVITLRYNVLGATYVRNEICPGQSETFVPKAENFPDNNQVEFVWSIPEDDQDIATVDPVTGVVTYTGKSGNVDLTLTSTSRIYDANSVKPVDTTTVKLIVNGGEIEVPDEPEDPDQPTFVENAYYKTTTLVPGKKYVLHTSYSDAPNLAFSNENKSGYVRLLCETTNAPQTDENGEYIVTTDNAHIWECVESGVDGYVYLKNVENGQYLFTSESEAATAKRQAGVAADLTHPEAANVTNAADSFLITYNSSNGMLFSKQVQDTGSVYGVGNVAKSSGGYYYIRPTYDGSSGSPVSYITLYAEPDKTETDSNYYYLTDSFVAGEKYILRAVKENESGATISIAVSGTKNGDTKLEGAAVSPVDNVIENEDANIVWIAEAGSDSTHFYLKNADTGEYLRIDKNGDIVTTSATQDDNAQLIYYEKNGQWVIGSKASQANLIRYNNAFYESSSGAVFELYQQGVAPEGGDTITEKNVYYLTETFEVGKKYLISNSNTVGAADAHVMSNQYYSENKILKAVSTEIKSNDNGTYISNPGSDVLIVEAVTSDVSNFVKLKTEDGKYLVVAYKDADGNSLASGDRKVLLADEGVYLPDQYLFRARYSTSSGFNVLMTNEGGALVYSTGTSVNRWSTSGTAKAIYIYGLDESTVPQPVEMKVQIRKLDYFGSVDITNIIEYRYDIDNGDTEQLYRYTECVQDGYTYSWSSSDTSIATIDQSTGLVTYTGREGHVTFNLTVTGNDDNGEAVNETVSTTYKVSSEPYNLSDEDYPAYPDEGSVRINKTASNAAGGSNFQNTGVTEIELGVTGVPVTQPVDVVVVLDHSDSMNGNNQLLNAINDTRNFALQLFNANENNRIAVVTFDQFRYHYESITSTSMINSETGNEDKIVTGDGTIQNAFVKFEQMDNLADDLDSLKVNAYGGTNYDSGLNYAYRILQYAKTDPNANDNQVVVFMSDGAPTKFNGLKLGSTESGTLSEAWITGDETNAELATYLADTATYPAAAYFNTDGENWFAKAIKTPEGQDVEGMPNVSLYNGYHTGLGAKIYTIGYNSGSQAAQLLTTMASDPSNYYPATTNLQAAYDSILEQILYAAEHAVVTDKMGDHFDVQFATEFSIGGSTVTLNPVPKFEIGYWTLDNLGNRVEYNVMETITFTTNANGVLTAASSSIIGDCYDTASSTVIGQYVSYNLNTETFTWNVGDITRNEITLKYYACLEGAANGEREAGTFETNEYATLAYTNYRGTECSKTFPVPTLAWKQAAVSYDFYLVNAAGQPINRQGVVVPFAERVLIGREQTKQLLLNSNVELTAYELIAGNEIPSGYVLYNNEAKYNISVSSTNANSSAVITDSTLTTYYRDGSYSINVNGNVPNVSDYSNTAVSFAVKYTEGIIPDSVVIDYGLPVKISVLGNDYAVTGGSITKIGKTLADGTVLHSGAYTTSHLTGGTTDVALTYGKASIDGEYVVYTPTTTAMDNEEVFYYEYKTADNKYYYTTITVIPAANIYYEESFMTFVDGQDDYKWEDVGTAITGRFQEEDRPGTFSFAEYDAGNAYGEDSAYDDSYTYSLGNAKKTTVDAAAYGKEATAKFTFCGTGFDLFSVTSNETGAVQVTIYKAGTTTIYKNFLVNTYYGYKLEEGVPLPDLNSTAGLYQVPIVSRRDLTYGTYDVVIKPLYSSAFDPNYNSTANKKDNDYSIYVDSVRIFNPAGIGESLDNEVIKDAYYKDGEYAPSFMEIRDTVLTLENFYDELVENEVLEGLGFTGSIFLDGNSANGIDDTALATYKTNGPKNELYLGKGQAIAFTVSSADKEALASLQLGMKVVSGGETAKVTIMNTSEKYPNSITLSGTHETFKKINSAIIWDQNEINYEDMTQNVYSTLYPIVIANTSDTDTVISLTSFKWAHTTKPESGDAEPAAVNFMVYDSTPALATMALRNAMAAQEVNKESKTYNEEDISIEWVGDTFVEGKEATLKVTTPPEVVKVTVDGSEITECEIGENGDKLWSYTFVTEQPGENAYEVVFYDYNGDASKPVMTETIVVEEAPEEPTTQEPTTGTPEVSEPATDVPEVSEPATDVPEVSEPATDEPEVSEPETSEPATDEPAADESVYEKVIRILSDFFTKVWNFIKSIIEFFWRLFA